MKSMVSFFTLAAMTLTGAGGATAQTLTARGLASQTGYQQFQAELTATDKRLSTLIGKNTETTANHETRIRGLERELETLRALYFQQGAGASPASPPSLLAGEDTDTDTDTLPIMARGIQTVRASCPSGYTFTGAYDAPRPNECGDFRVHKTSWGATVTACPTSPLALTIYCSR